MRGAVGTQPTEHINPQLKKIIKNTILQYIVDRFEEALKGFAFS